MKYYWIQSCPCRVSRQSITYGHFTGHSRTLPDTPGHSRTPRDIQPRDKLKRTICSVHREGRWHFPGFIDTSLFWRNFLHVARFLFRFWKGFHALCMFTPVCINEHKVEFVEGRIYVKALSNFYCPYMLWLSSFIFVGQCGSHNTKSKCGKK